MAQQQPPVAHTRHGDFTVDQLAEMTLPGLGTIMPQVSDRYWIMYYAAQGGNWELAQYQLHELRGLLKLGATTRPRFAKFLNAFAQGHLLAVERAIQQEDFAAFQTSFRRGIQGANRYHEETGHPEIVWQLPSDPPKHLALALVTKKADT